MLFSILAIVILFFFLLKSPEKCLLLVFIWYPTLTILPVCRGINVTTLFIYLLLFYTFIKKGKQAFLSYPFLWPFVICISSYVISAIFGYKIALSVARWVEQYFLAWTMWALYKSSKSNDNFLFFSLMAYLLLLDVYAMFESVTVMNPFLDYLRSSGIDIPYQSATYMRYGLYRSQSLTIWTSIMATSSGLGAVFMAYAFFSKRLEPSPILYAAWVFCLIGVFISGTRSVMVVTTIASFCFLRNLINVKYIILLGSLIFIAVSFTGDFFSEVVDSFVHSDEAGGSSVEQRGMQFLVAFKYWMVAPFIGNGLDFTDFLVSQNVGLLGAESIIFRLLIDRGIVGFLSFVFLYSYSIWMLVKKGLSPYSFILVGFCFGKVVSLLYTLEEAYVFSYVVLLYKIVDEKKLDALKAVLVEKCKEYLKAKQKKVNDYNKV